jgi:argininosuccinate lyase
VSTGERTGKLWGGRFQRGLLPELEAFSSSLEVDYELYPYDIAGSIAHARGLAAAGLLDDATLEAVERGLTQVRRELDEGRFAFVETDEDIHTAVERRLTELEPDAGARLHAGRSRNDQVALDLRLWCRAGAAVLVGELGGLVEALAALAGRHADWPMPGYTHLQRAQPTTVGHHLLAHAEALLRDVRRVRHAYDAADELPLGSGALAGSTLPLRRDVVAGALGLARLSANSMDAVSDRDFALDLVYACTVLGLHLSRLGEDVMLWSSAEFGFVRLADEISTGSSIMPQKKNPDRDLEESKAPLIAAVHNATECAEAAALMVERLEFDRERMGGALGDPDLYATDTAERMVAEGAAFRDAHRRVGREVAERAHRPPWDAARSLEMRDLEGAPHPERVRARAAEVGAEAGSATRWAEEHPPAMPGRSSVEMGAADA